MLEEIALSVLIIAVIVLALTSCNGKHLSDEHPAVNEPADEHPE